MFLRHAGFKDAQIKRMKIGNYYASYKQAKSSRLNKAR
jgi:hypothetical protein